MRNTDNICLVKKNGIYRAVGVQTLFPLVALGQNERFECVFIQTGASVNLKIVLTAPGAFCDLKAVYLASGSEEKSFSLEVVHESPGTRSLQTVKGVVADSARCSFSGVIRIRPQAQKCSGVQNHRAVLLSDKAFVKATPELEIYADDVVCSHGSAVGPLDLNQKFYLQSRGIDEKNARQILLFAFLSDVLPEGWHAVVQEWLDEHL